MQGVLEGAVEQRSSPQTVAQALKPRWSKDEAVGCYVLSARKVEQRSLPREASALKPGGPMGKVLGRGLAQCDSKRTGPGEPEVGEGAVPQAFSQRTRKGGRKGQRRGCWRSGRCTAAQTGLLDPQGDRSVPPVGGARAITPKDGHRVEASR